MQHLEYEIDDETQDQEIDERGNKASDPKYAEFEIAKAPHWPNEETHQRIDNVVHQGFDERLRRTAKDKADSKTGNAAFAQKGDKASEGRLRSCHDVALPLTRLFHLNICHTDRV